MPDPPLPPGPRLPMLGTLIMPGRDPLAIFTRFARTYGDIMTFRMSGERVVFINHPDYIRQVLVVDHANFTKSRALERARKLLGDGLLTSEGAVHARRRRLLQPAFHRARIAAYADSMVQHAERLSDRWIDGATLDVSGEMMRLTLGIVARTLFDVDVEEKADTIGRALTEVLESFWLTLLPFSDAIEALPLAALRRSAEARAHLDGLIYAMISARRQAGAGGTDLLSMLIAAADEGGPGLTDREVRDEAMTLLLAGHETTANALTWTWYLLSQSPDVTARLHEEVDRVVGRITPPSSRSLESLRYTTQVATESMRLYPPVWTIGRRARAACTIGGYHVPAGALVFMSQWTMHRDARYFDAPERFRPERWTPALAAALPKHAYFPFGGGPRMCIGESFAWMELALILATIARRWRLELVPGHPVATQPLITLRARHGMKMIVRRRH